MLAEKLKNNFSFIFKIINIGIDDTLDLYQKKEIKFLNLFSLAIIGSVIFGLIDLSFFDGNDSIEIELSLAFFSIFVPYLNYKKQYAKALFVFVFFTNLYLLIVNLYYLSSAGNYLYYFPDLFCTALLHNPKKPLRRTIAMFSVIGLSISGAYFLNYLLIAKAPINNLQNHYILLYNIFNSSLLTMLSIALIVRQLNNQHKEFTNLVEQINTDKITIKNSLDEKEVLLSEVQHRVKNNLSVLIGLFNLQLDQSENEEYRTLLIEAKNRVLSIAMVHQKIYNKSDLSKINLSNYVSDLIQEIVKSHSLRHKVHIFEELNSIDVNVTTAVPIGLIVNEVITNSLKHAFVEGNKKPVLNVGLEVNLEKLVMKFKDNGIGFPKNNDTSNRTLGITLINSLCEQLDGEINFKNDNGAVVELTLPLI